MTITEAAAALDVTRPTLSELVTIAGFRRKWR
jgi:plasmid maintenance system antidote protein VapI